MAVDMNVPPNERDPRTHAVIGAAMEVHNQLGHGFLEAVYQEALTLELQARGVPFRRQPDLPIFYKGELLPCAYRPDFVCFEEVIVELKATSALGGPDQAQVLNYLRAAAKPLGLLINFGTPRLEYRRLIFSAYLKKGEDTSTDVADERR